MVSFRRAGTTSPSKFVDPAASPAIPFVSLELDCVFRVLSSGSDGASRVSSSESDDASRVSSTLPQALLYPLSLRNSTAPPVSYRQDPMVPPVSLPRNLMTLPVSLARDLVAPPVPPRREPIVPLVSLPRDLLVPPVSPARDPAASLVSPPRDPVALPVSPPRDLTVPPVSPSRDPSAPPVSPLCGPAPPVFPVFFFVIMAAASAPAPVPRAAESLFFRLIHLHSVSRRGLHYRHRCCRSCQACRFTARPAVLLPPASAPRKTPTGSSSRFSLLEPFSASSPRSGARACGVPPLYHALSPPPPVPPLDSASISYLRRPLTGPSSLFSSRYYSRF